VKTFLEFVKEFMPATRARRKGSLNPSSRDIRLLEKALTNKVEPYFVSSDKNISVMCTIAVKKSPGWGECIKCELLADGYSIEYDSVWNTTVEKSNLWSALAVAVDKLDEDYYLTDEWKRYNAEGVFAVGHDLWGGPRT